MNTLSKIQKQALVVSNEKKKLLDLENQYVKEERKYNDGDFVSFNNYGTLKLGKITRARYGDNPRGVGIIYTITIVNKNGLDSKSDKSFYYILERELTPYEITNP